MQNKQEEIKNCFIIDVGRGLDPSLLPTELGFFMLLPVSLWYILKIWNEFQEHLSYALITESLPTLGTKTVYFYFATLTFHRHEMTFNPK